MLPTLMTTPCCFVLEGTTACLHGLLIADCCCCNCCHLIKATTLLLVTHSLELSVFVVWLLISCSYSQPAALSCSSLLLPLYPVTIGAASRIWE